MFLYFLIGAVAALWVYILLIRPWLVRRHPVIFGWIDTTEAKLYQRSRALLVARAYMIGGLILMAHETLISFGYNFQPILDQITSLVSEPWRPYVLGGFVILTGFAMNYLRKSHVAESTAGNV